MPEPQLPDTDVKTVADIVGILRRRKWNVVVPALVAIPEIVTPKDIRRRKMRNGLLVGTSLAAIAIGVVLFHFYVMDRDVVWAKLMRRWA